MIWKVSHSGTENQTFKLETTEGQMLDLGIRTGANISYGEALTVPAAEGSHLSTSPGIAIC